jgi:sulfatase maturation enzyme AslB (radical SAM superfamily)
MPKYIGTETLPLLKDFGRVSFETLSRAERDITAQLLDLGFAFDNEHPETDLSKISSNLNPVLSTMYLVLSHECNLACKYCFVESIFQKTTPFR